MRHETLQKILDFFKVTFIILTGYFSGLCIAHYVIVPLVTVTMTATPIKPVNEERTYGYTVTENNYQVKDNRFVPPIPRSSACPLLEGTRFEHIKWSGPITPEFTCVIAGYQAVIGCTRFYDGRVTQQMKEITDVMYMSCDAGDKRYFITHQPGYNEYKFTRIK